MKERQRLRRKQTAAQQRFEQMVRVAIDRLPPALRHLLGDVPVVVEEEPSTEDLAAVGLPPEETLLGMYHGVPLTERPSSFGLALPERISIYRRPTEEICHTRQETIWEVQSTLVHELAHHFGISEERLKELGWE